MGRNKLIDPIAFLTEVFGHPLKKFNFGFLNFKWMKKIPVHHIPARSLQTFINPDPFIQSNKGATSYIQVSGFYVFNQPMKDLDWCISGCQTNNSIGFISNVLTNPVGCLS